MGGPCGRIAKEAMLEEDGLGGRGHVMLSDSEELDNVAIVGCDFVLVTLQSFIFDNVTHFHKLMLIAEHALPRGEELAPFVRLGCQLRVIDDLWALDVVFQRLQRWEPLTALEKELFKVVKTAVVKGRRRCDGLESRHRWGTLNTQVGLGVNIHLNSSDNLVLGISPE